MGILDSLKSLFKKEKPEDKTKTEVSKPLILNPSMIIQREMLTQRR